MNEPAFPVLLCMEGAPEGVVTATTKIGLTKREWFIGMLAQGSMAYRGFVSVGEIIKTADKLLDEANSSPM